MEHAAAAADPARRFVTVMLARSSPRSSRGFAGSVFWLSDREELYFLIVHLLPLPFEQLLKLLLLIFFVSRNFRGRLLGKRLSLLAHLVVQQQENFFLLFDKGI